MKRGLRLIALFSTALSVCLFGGCSHSANQIERVETTSVVALPAKAPDGVVRYCWEEPVVEEQKEGPGLDFDGHWYHPDYKSIREVRQGRWRPCEKQTSEVLGGNE